MSTKHIFVCGNTSKGFRNLLSTNIPSLNKLFVMNEGPSALKSIAMVKIGMGLLEHHYDVEYIHSSTDPDFLDGILVTKLGIGIVNGAARHLLETTIPESIIENVNLVAGWDTDKLRVHKDEIQNVQNNIEHCYDNAYEEFAKALKVHDEWEKIYITNMNFTKANQLTEDVIIKLLGSSHLKKTSFVKHRFFGNSTPYGSRDYVENITENIATRYFIKGRPGSGKSTMMKKILEKAQFRGLDVEVYHCGFDPDSLDMLLFPELSLCIFDSTSPHEYFPSRDGDSVIDMYTELINSNTDEIYATELEDIAAHYKSFIKEGTVQLVNAKRYNDELEQFYIEASDYKIIDKIYDELYAKVMSLNSD